MPYQDEEYPGQPLWQSVLLFCCKGMIEGIMVLLFLWLLVQVLFTKQLEGMVLKSWQPFILVMHWSFLTTQVHVTATKSLFLYLKLVSSQIQSLFVLLIFLHSSTKKLSRYKRGRFYNKKLWIWKIISLNDWIGVPKSHVIMHVPTDEALWILSPICSVWITSVMVRNDYEETFFSLWIWAFDYCCEINWAPIAVKKILWCKVRGSSSKVVLCVSFRVCVSVKFSFCSVICCHLTVFFFLIHVDSSPSDSSFGWTDSLLSVFGPGMYSVLEEQSRLCDER